ncbi:MAG TPA: glycosyltransferase family 2 protein [Sedimentisphaerales bacterium]|nr:glycosyltransferase family 2 protein [Sedimentisphaerales bacterium]HNU29426.1 glycosyltransferase family 2 protein [Sedimentisphaerales bacterium]
MATGIDKQTMAAVERTMSRQATAETAYTVVTPAYNEQTNLPATIRSMVSQTLKPLAWVIVDDGSADDTWNIIHEAAGVHPWIVGLRREKKQKTGTDGLLVASEAEAFLDGWRLASAQFSASAFVVKLDADLEFGPEYFASLLDEFQRNPRLGIAGGVIYEYRGTDLAREKVSKAHVRGATKVYRKCCYQDIHGVRPVFGWDVIDEIEARAHGWDVQSFDHLHLVHLRRTASRGGRFAGWARNGYMAYYIGMSPLRMFTRALSRLLATGDIIQSSGLAYGYFSNLLRRTSRLPDPDIRRLVRQHQWVTLHAYVKSPNATPPIKEIQNE